MTRALSSTMVAILALALACAGPGPSAAPTGGREAETEAAATQAASETEAGQEAGAEGQDRLRARLEAMLAARPDDGALLYVFARSAATRGEDDEALALLERLVAVEAWDYPPERSDFGALAERPEFIRLAEILEARAPEVEHGEVAMELDRVDLLPEGVAWDAERERLLVGSMRERAVFAADRAGHVSELVAPRSAGLLAVLGMDVDRERDRVWVAAFGHPYMDGFTEADAGRTGVWGFALADGASVQVAMVEGPAVLNDLVVLDDGRVVATDALGGRVFALAPGSDALEPIVARETFVGANGIAAAAGDEAVYVADLFGLHHVALADGAVTSMAAPAPATTLGGIDGLARSGEVLVGIQNLFSPGRVWALRLGQDQRSLVEARILDDGHPRLGGPTTGAFVGPDRFWYLGNASLQFGPEGMLEAGPDERHVILELEL